MHNRKGELTKRERQIMEIIYRRRTATVKQVLADITDPPSYSTVRALLGILERKSYLKHRKEGLKYNYLPTVSKQKATNTAIKGILKTYFDNSIEDALVAIIRLERRNLSESDLDRIVRLIKDK